MQKKLDVRARYDRAAEKRHFYIVSTIKNCFVFMFIKRNVQAYTYS